MAVQLSASYLRRSYQLLAGLRTDRMSGEEAFEKASDLIYAWGRRKKFYRIFRQLPYQKATLEDRRDGNEIGVIYEPEQGNFIFRAAHPDTGVPGRMWITDVQLRRSGEDCLFAVRLSATSLQSCGEEVPFSVPGFVRRVMEEVGLTDVAQLSGQSTLLSTREEVSGFLQFLEDPGRRLPVILLTPCYSPGDGPWGGYLMDAAAMAADLTGAAHVFQIAPEVNELLTEWIGKQWSAFNGAVRTYYPGVSFQESSYYRHPLLTPQKIRAYDSAEGEEAGESGRPEKRSPCMCRVEEYVQNYVLSQRIPWEESGIDFYLSAQQERLQERRTASSRSQEERLSFYAEQLEQLHRQAEENLSLAVSIDKDCASLREENEQQRQTIAQLKAQVSALRYQLENATGESQTEAVPEDGTYADLEEWAGRYYPDRLLLLPRAVRSLKAADYTDPALVYRCLKLLATAYYDYRTGGIDREGFMEACRRVDTGLDERPAITDTAAGMQGETYYVQYRGKRRKLERHLAKGNSKDTRYCLRIYYFWDDQDQVVVIGDLPHHLDTTAT